MKVFPFLLFGTLLIGCGGGGSSSDGDPEARADASQGEPTSTSVDAPSSNDTPAVVFGTVVDAVSGAPLGGVEVRLADGSGSGARSGASGRYVFSLREATGAVALTFSRDGYLGASYADPGGDGALELEAVALVPLDNAGVGGLSGAVATGTGAPVVGASVRFLAGINVREGDAVASTTTGPDGTWQVVDLPFGNYTCIILVDGADAVYEPVQVFGGVDRSEQNVTISGGGSAPSTPASSVFEPVFPPEQDRAAFVEGQSSWSVPGHGWSADGGAYTVNRFENVGLLALVVSFGQVTSPRDPWANSRLTLQHTFVGSGSYRVVDSFRKLEAAARIGDKVVLVQFRASNSFDLLRSFSVQYDGVEGASSSSLVASVDERGRYHFSTDSPILVRQSEPQFGTAPADAEPELDLTITEAFVP